MRNRNRTKQKLKKYSQYDKIISKRDKTIKSISLDKTPTLRAPASVVADPGIYEKTAVWSQGLKMWKIAADNYGDGTLYWVIALYNNRPTDAHWEIGDVVYIPFPLELAVQMLEY